MKGHTARINCIVPTADSRFVLSSSEDGTIKRWDLQQENWLQEWKFDTDKIVLTADDHNFLFDTGEKGIEVLSLETGKEQFLLKGHTRHVNAYTFTLDGRKLITGAKDTTIKIWNLEKGRCVKTLDLHQTWVNAVHLIDADHLLLSTSDDDTLLIWDMVRGKCVHSQAEFGHLLTITPDSRRLISWKDGRLFLWDIETLKAIYDIPEASQWVQLTPDGRYLIVVTHQAEISIINLNKLKSEAKPNSEARLTLESPITVSALSRDGKKIIVGDEAGRVHFFYLENL